MELGEIPTSSPLPSIPPDRDIDLIGESTNSMASPAISSDPISRLDSDPKTPNRPKKRPGSLLGPRPNKKNPFTFTSLASSQPAISQASQKEQQAKDFISQARSLLIKAADIEPSLEKQSNILDLIEILRDYTEKGLAPMKTSNKILANQVICLEQVARKLENSTKNALAPQGYPRATPQMNQQSQPSQPSQPKQPSWATIVRNSTSVPSTNKVTSQASKLPPKKDAYKQKRLIAIMDSEQVFSSLELRNKLNNAFSNKGVKEPVVASITKAQQSNNLIITTTSSFDSQYLIDKESIWGTLIKYKRIQKDHEWAKVVISGIPLTDFNNRDLSIINEEITTFNKGLSPIGTPYWLTPLSRRENLEQRFGKIIVSFATKEEANKAVQRRLYIAGISVRVEHYNQVSRSTQCSKCQAFGHLEATCKRPARCKLCSESHHSKLHYCNTCNSKAKCIHLVPKCINCKESHTADDKNCQVYKAVKKLPINRL